MLLCHKTEVLNAFALKILLLKNENLKETLEKKRKQFAPKTVAKKNIHPTIYFCPPQK